MFPTSSPAQLDNFEIDVNEFNGQKFLLDDSDQKLACDLILELSSECWA